MRQNWLLQIVIAVFLAGVAAGQTGTALSGPTLGLVFDSSQSALRPIRGIPGAASLGDPVNAGFSLASATVSPQQGYAIALKADDSSVVLVRAGGASAAIPGARPAPALVVFSPAGTAAALYDSGAGRVQILTGLPDAAAVQSDVDISALAGPVAALAVDDAGSSLFLAVGPAETVSLYRIAADGASQFLAPFRSVAALRLSGNGREALLADSAAGARTTVRRYRADAVILLLGIPLYKRAGVGSGQVSVEFSGNPLGVLLDDIQLIQLPATNYNNYYLPEEPLTPFVGENPLGCWTLDVWDTRDDSPNPTDGE